jgi:hypothetical protein
MNSPIPPPGKSSQTRTTKDLTVAQRLLVQIMSEYQFGRIENLRVEGGQPVPDQQTRIVRSVRLGASATDPGSLARADYELGEPARDLFAELGRLANGVAERIEFRYGEPCLIETLCGRFTTKNGTCNHCGPSPCPAVK